MYKDKFFQQVDGVATESLLGPTFPNFFIGHKENKMFSNCYIFFMLMIF